MTHENDVKFTIHQASCFTGVQTYPFIYWWLLSCCRDSETSGLQNLTHFLADPLQKSFVDA